MRDGLHREDGESFDLVVVTGVIAERTFVSHLSRFEVTFEDIFCRRRYPQTMIAAQRGMALGEFRLAASQQARESIFRNGIGNRGDRSQGGRRIGSECDGNRIAFAGIGQLPVTVVQRSAPV